MARWISVAIAATVLFLCAATAALASNFPGWAREYDAGSVQLLSPPDAAGLRVAFAMTVALTMDTNNPKQEFSDAIGELIVGLSADAVTLQRSGVKVQSGLHLEALKMRRGDGVMIDLVVAMYPVAGSKWEILFLLYPSALTDSDPRVIQALDFLATAYNARFALQDPRRFDASAPAAKSLTSVSTSRTPPAQQSAPPPPQRTSPPPAQQGKRCERRPVWGPQVSAWCYPSGVCNNLVIKYYEDVCE
jgi:hypothetical protein